MQCNLKRCQIPGFPIQKRRWWLKDIAREANKTTCSNRYFSVFLAYVLLQYHKPLTYSDNPQIQLSDQVWSIFANKDRGWKDLKLVSPAAAVCGTCLTSHLDNQLKEANIWVKCSWCIWPHYLCPISVKSPAAKHSQLNTKCSIHFQSGPMDSVECTKIQPTTEMFELWHYCNQICIFYAVFVNTV